VTDEGAARHRLTPAPQRSNSAAPPPLNAAPQRRWSAVTLVLVLSTVVLAGILTLWACVSPDYRAPDEPLHVSTTLRLAYDHSYPAPGDARIFRPVKASFADVGFGGIGLNTIIGLAPLKHPTSAQLGHQTMSQLGAANTSPVTPYDYDQMTQHPPGYYAIMAVAARAFDVINKTPRTALLILRLCSALLLLPLPFLTYRIARALGVVPLGAAAASFLPAGLPQFTHIGGAVNNDALTVTLGAAVTWLALEVVLRDRVRPWAVGLGIAMSALLLTKGIALPMLVVPFLAFCVRARRRGLRPTLPDALLAGALMLPGLAWWVANIIRFGKLQPDGYPKSYLNLIPNGTLSFGGWLHGFFPAMSRSFFSDVGWLEAPPPTSVTVALTAVLLALVVIGVLRARERRALVLLAQLSWLMPLVAILVTSHAAWAREHQLQGVQGRYLFVGVAALAATIAVAVRPRATAEISARRAAGYAALPLVALVTAGLGLAAAVSHFYVGAGLRGQIGTFSAWSPLRLREIAVIVAVVVAAGAVAAGVILVGRTADTSSPDADRPEADLEPAN
jgi:hypothetical protein